MSDASQRTIPATPRRRQEAEDAGMMPTASLLAWCGSLAAVIAFLPAWCRLVADASVEAVRAAAAPFGRGESFPVEPLVAIVAATAALALAALAAAVAIRLVFDRIRFRPSRCLPDGRRVDPLRGVARAVSWAALGRLVQSALALAMLAAVAGFALGPLALDPGRSFGGEPLATAVPAWRSLWPIVAAAAAVGLAQWALGRLRFERRIRMTPQEYQEELRSLEADPKVKLQRHDARRAALAREAGR